MSEVMDADPTAVRIIDGRYRLLLPPLGAGRTGTVHVAQPVDGGPLVAIKLLALELACDDDFRQAFHRAAAASVTQSGRHPALARLFEYGQSDDRSLYVVMEYVDGRSLADILEQYGPLEWPRAVGLAARIAEALQAAHAEFGIHGDVRPSNVVVLPDDTVKLIGLELALMTKSHALQRLTRDRLAVAVYTAPEQIGWYEITPEADVYALGVALYEMLCGVPPFEAGRPHDVLLKHLNELPTPLRKRARAVPRTLERSVMQILAKDPEQRPSLADIVTVLRVEAARGGSLSALGRARHALTGVGADVTDVAKTLLTARRVVPVAAALLLVAALLVWVAGAARWAAPRAVTVRAEPGPGAGSRTAAVVAAGTTIAVPVTPTPTVAGAPAVAIEPSAAPAPPAAPPLMTGGTQEARRQAPRATRPRRNTGETRAPETVAGLRPTSVQAPTKRPPPAARELQLPATERPSESARPATGVERPSGNDPADARGVIDWLVREHLKRP